MVEKEMPKCPVCGGETVTESVNGEAWTDCETVGCQLSGPIRDTEEEARAVFARLRLEPEQGPPIAEFERDFVGHIAEITGISIDELEKDPETGETMEQTEDCEHPLPEWDAEYRKWYIPLFTEQRPVTHCPDCGAELTPPKPKTEPETGETEKQVSVQEAMERVRIKYDSMTDEEYIRHIDKRGKSAEAGIRELARIVAASERHKPEIQRHTSLAGRQLTTGPTIDGETMEETATEKKLMADCCNFGQTAIYQDLKYSSGWVMDVKGHARPGAHFSKIELQVGVDECPACKTALTPPKPRTVLVEMPEALLQNLQMVIDIGKPLPNIVFEINAAAKVITGDVLTQESAEDFRSMASILDGADFNQTAKSVREFLDAATIREE